MAQPQTYYSNSFTPFIVFFALFLVVVRSQKLPHFLRFNALQSMLLDISIMLSGLIIQVQATCHTPSPCRGNSTFRLTCPSQPRGSKLGGQLPPCLEPRS
jgi:hypothetical protein